MDVKTIVGIILVAFIIGSIVFLNVRGRRKNNKQNDE